MASKGMWLSLEILFRNFALPDYIIQYHADSRKLQRGSKKEWIFLIVYVIYCCTSNCCIFYYHFSTATSTALEIPETERALLILFAMLFTSIGIMSGVFLYSTSCNRGH